jgi:hypothetical protein
MCRTGNNFSAWTSASAVHPGVRSLPYGTLRHLQEARVQHVVLRDVCLERVRGVPCCRPCANGEWGNVMSFLDGHWKRKLAGCHYVCETG